jgi:hypothetical protein
VEIAEKPSRKVELHALCVLRGENEEAPRQSLDLRVLSTVPAFLTPTSELGIVVFTRSANNGTEILAPAYSCPVADMKVTLADNPGHNRTLSH